MVDGVEVSVTTSKIVTDNDAKNEEMRFLRWVCLPWCSYQATTVYDLINMDAFNSSWSVHSSLCKSHMDYLQG